MGVASLPDRDELLHLRPDPLVFKPWKISERRTLTAGLESGIRGMRSASHRSQSCQRPNPVPARSAPAQTPAESCKLSNAARGSARRRESKSEVPWGAEIDRAARRPMSRCFHSSVFRQNHSHRPGGTPARAAVLASPMWLEDSGSMGPASGGRSRTCEVHLHE